MKPRDMASAPQGLNSMTAFNPYEPAILHDRLTDKIETWTGEDAADFREGAIFNPDGTAEWRQFMFDGWGDVLGLAADDRHVGAVPGQGLGDPAADARRAARDQRDPAGEQGIAEDAFNRHSGSSSGEGFHAETQRAAETQRGFTRRHRLPREFRHKIKKLEFSHWKLFQI